MTYFSHLCYKLENHAEIFSGIVYRKLKSYEGNDSVYFLQLKNVMENGKIDISELDKVKTDKSRIQSKYFLRKNDIIIKAKSSSYGAGIIEDDLDDMDIVPSSQLIVVRVKEDEEILPGFLWLYLNSKEGKEEIMRQSYGSVIKFVKTDTLKNIIVKYPPKEKQKEAIDIYNKMLKREEILKRLLNLTREEKELFFDKVFEE